MLTNCIIIADSFDPFDVAPAPYSNVEHPAPPSSYFGDSISRPYPTNKWFQNFVLDQANQPIMPMPYRYYPSISYILSP